MCSSASSCWSDTVPLTATHRYWFAGSRTSTETRGSVRRLLSLARPTAVLNHTSPSTSSIQTTVECGDPSGRSVVAVAGKALSRMNALCSSVKVAAAVFVVNGAPFVVAGRRTHSHGTNAERAAGDPRGEASLRRDLGRDVGDLPGDDLVRDRLHLVGQARRRLRAELAEADTLPAEPVHGVGAAVEVAAVRVVDREEDGLVDALRRGGQDVRAEERLVGIDA